jgi:SanA protein
MPEASPAHAQRRWGRWLAGCALVLTLAIAAGSSYVVSVTGPRRLAEVAEAPPQPYAIVLGNRVFPGGRPSQELACRLETGRQLYAAGRARRVIVSGLARPDIGYDEPAAMAAWLEARGVPGRDVILDRGGYRTAASMADAAAIGVRTLLVVSQPYHLPRALYLAQHAGIQAWGVGSCNGPRNWLERAHIGLREAVARTEAILEVLVRGVRGAGPVPENRSARRVANGDPLG